MTDTNDDISALAATFDEQAQAPAAPDRKDIKGRVTALVDEYTVHDPDSPMNGHIIPRKEQEFLDDLAALAYDATIDCAQDVEGAQRNKKARNLYHDIAESLGPIVFTWAKTKDDRKPSSRELKYGNDVTEHAFAHGYTEFTKDYFRPQPPIPGYKEDIVTFLKAAKRINGNVKSPTQAANSLQRFLERVHAKSGTPGATEHQAALYLVSDTTGGTGKSFNLTNGVLPCFRSLGFDAAEIACFDPQWPTPVIALQHISVLQDVDRLEDISPTYLNALIDGQQTHYNQKFGATGQVHSQTSLVMASNKFVWDPNDRRWCTIEYLTNSVLLLTDEERAKYFPLWGDPEGYKQAWLTMLRSVPFGRQWELPRHDQTDYTIVVSPRYADVIYQLKKYLDKCPSDSRAWGSIRPTELVSDLLNDVDTHMDPYEQRNFKKVFRELVKWLHAHNHLTYKGGQDPMRAEQYIASVINLLETSPNYVMPGEKEDENPFEATAREWDRLIAKAEAAQAAQD